MLEFLAPAFVALFVVIDPIGLAPIFVGVTRDLDKKARQRVAIRGVLIAAAILAVFGFAGEAVLGALGVGMPAFRISGGIMLFLIAVEMLFEKRTERRTKSAEASQHADDDVMEAPSDPSVFPLATPLIAGPGAMATLVLLMGQAEGDLVMQAALIGVMLVVLLLCLIFFLLASGLERVVGATGINVITRLLGVLLGALSVQFILDGLADYGVFAPL